MSCIERHADEGSTGATSIAASPDGSTYAVGSTMGVVNMYDSSLERSSRSGAAAGGSLLQRALAGQLGSSEGSGAAAHAGFVVRKPVHTVMNLTTAVSGLTYSHDGQLLVMSSQRGRDSMRVVHCASGTVFSNWPTARTPLHYVTATDFSPHSGYLAVGNDKGRVLLYRVNHYQEA
ncbi:hypothetical protein EON62_05160 [archaeon]|nr:MAG: hypothetical protein EON62_05160 [archaeon]